MIDLLTGEKGGGGNMAGRVHPEVPYMGINRLREPNFVRGARQLHLYK